MEKDSEIRTGCKYCDIGTGPRNYDGDLVCNGCGAEWADCKIEYEVSARELERERKDMEAYEQMSSW